MAKKRKEKDEENEIDFKIPKFDKEKFIKNEKQKVKITFLSFLFGVAIAFISFGFWVLLKGNDFRWELVLLFGVFTAAWLKYIFIRLNIDMKELGRKGIFTSYAIYFFTWLLILMIVINPPFYDDEAPHIEAVLLPSVQELGGTVKIIARITDNVAIFENDIKLEITDPNGNSTTISKSEIEFNDFIFKYIYKNPRSLLGEFNYVLTAKDQNGLVQTEKGSFSYDEQAISITAPPSSFFKNITSGVDIKIEVKEEVSSENFRVYYTLNNGNEINVDRKNKDEKDEYETSTKFDGWIPNDEYSMKVYVETSYYFTNIPTKYSNIIQDTTIYNISTANDAGIGAEDVPMPWNWSSSKKNQAPITLNYDTFDTDNDGNPENDILLPHPRSVQVPGFELMVFIISFILAILLFKFRKKEGISN